MAKADEVESSFQALWTAFPKIRGDRASALRNWRNLTANQRTQALAALPDWLDYWEAKGEPEFIPAASSWIGTKRSKHGFEGFVPPHPSKKKTHQSEIMKSLNNIRERDSL